ncbi:hypothetical protein SAMN05421840_11136 [Shewanella morhuae]|nr:hypothetical protein SAMN05421840_11136 [Shewanella morhuae]
MLLICYMCAYENYFSMQYDTQMNKLSLADND